MPSSKIANYGVDLYKLKVNPGGKIDVSAGEFRVDGDLVVTGSTTFVSSEDLNITDNIITVNSGETGSGVTKDLAGLEVDRGEFPNAQILFDENLIDIGNDSTVRGSFRFSFDNGELASVYASSIKTLGNSDLYLLDETNTSGLVIVSSANYSGNLFNYSPGSEPIPEANLRSPADEDALINAKSLIDYVDSYHLYNWQDRIVSLDNPDTRVVADSETIKNVKIIVGNSTIGEFTLDGATFTNVAVKGQITTFLANSDLVLAPNGTGNVNVSNKKIVNLADPTAPTDAVNVRYLESRIGNLDLFDSIDISGLEDGSMLVYNGTTEKFEGTKLLDNQIIDAGIY
jgi:hypothetical protein